jgi:hypothetical protein
LITRSKLNNLPTLVCITHVLCNSHLLPHPKSPRSKLPGTYKYWSSITHEAHVALNPLSLCYCSLLPKQKNITTIYESHQQIITIMRFSCICQIRGRVNWLVTNHPMIKDFGKSFSILPHLSDLKCYKSTFSSFTNHLWNVKPKDQPKKSCKENMFFWIAKHFFFSFFFILTPPTFKPHNFAYFLFILND